MPGPLQNKLQHFEVAPPPGVWDKLSRRLDEEFVASDNNLALKLEETSITPPAAIWNKLNAELHGNIVHEEQQPPKVVSMFRRIAVAAVIIGLLFLGGWYFLKSNRPENNIVEKVPEKGTVPSVVTERSQGKLPDSGNSVAAAKNETSAKTKSEAIRPVPKPRVTEEPVTEDIIEDVPFTDYAAKPEEAPLYDLQTVSALQPVSVTAPPLRDKKGNIILDASLISHPDDEYITVTGPNGKQTKISSKFLSCLGYINANLTSNDVDTRAIQCKTQFEEWRKKILAQPAFIPTANNFFDIFELKDLLQEM